MGKTSSHARVAQANKKKASLQIRWDPGHNEGFIYPQFSEQWGCFRAKAAPGWGGAIIRCEIWGGGTQHTYTHTTTMQGLISRSAEHLWGSEHLQRSTAGVKSIQHFRRVAKHPQESEDGDFCVWVFTCGWRLRYCEIPLHLIKINRGEIYKDA